MKKFNDLIEAIFAGMMIGIGGTVYLSIENRYLGSFLFSFGLITILILKLKLYTGKIGFVASMEDAKKIPVFILGNAIGTFLISMVMRTNTKLIQAAESIMNAKFEKPWYTIFAMAFMCGIMMYIAVILYNKVSVNGTQSVSCIVVSMPIMIFILCGFEHSIANMFYAFLGAPTMASMILIINCILGNAAGSLFFSLVQRKDKG